MQYSKISLSDGIEIVDSVQTIKLPALSILPTATDAQIKIALETIAGKGLIDVHIHKSDTSSKEDNGTIPNGTLFVKTGRNDGLWPDTIVIEEEPGPGPELDLG